MAGRIILDACNPALDLNGLLDTGASLQFYENRTTTPQAIYDSIDLNAELPNPLTPDAEGRFPPTIWGPDGAVYTVEWTPTGESPITFNDIAVSPSNVEFVPVYISGKPADGETFPIFLPGGNRRLPANLSGTRAKCKGVDPTATATFTLKKNGLSIGSITFATDGTPTVTFSSSIDFSAGDPDSPASGDDFQIDAPSPQDATMTDIAFNIAFLVI